MSPSSVALYVLVDGVIAGWHNFLSFVLFGAAVCSKALQTCTWLVSIVFVPSAMTWRDVVCCSSVVVFSSRALAGLGGGGCLAVISVGVGGSGSDGDGGGVPWFLFCCSFYSCRA